MNHVIPSLLDGILSNESSTRKLTVTDDEGNTWKITRNRDDEIVIDDLDDSCPICGTSDAVIKHGTYGRDPHGSISVRIQRRLCQAHLRKRTFSADVPGIEAGFQFTDRIRDLVQIIFEITGTSTGKLRQICGWFFGEWPSTSTTHRWRSDPTGEIVTNDLPAHLYSGFYTYDEQEVGVGGETMYRLLLYDDLLRVPVAERIVEKCTDEQVRAFLAQALVDKRFEALTSDGRQGLGKIVDQLGGSHYRCRYHLLDNFEDDFRKVVSAVYHSEKQKKLAAVFGNTFRQIINAPDYHTARDRLALVRDQVADHEQIPHQVRKYIEKVGDEPKKFLGTLRDPRIPSTINSCERHYKQTVPMQLKKRFDSPEYLQAFCEQTMPLRTVREGLLSDEVSLMLVRQQFPDVTEESLVEFYTERKNRYRELGDFKPG